MKTKSFTSSFLELNFAMLLISTSGVLCTVIDIPIPVTIASRTLIASIILYFFCRWKKKDFTIKSKDRKSLIVSGLLLGAHWITYFYAIKLSSIAIGMLSLYTFPAITTFLEPFFSKTKILKFHLLLSALVLVGIYFLVPDLAGESKNLKAVGIGMLSAFCYSLRVILLKSKVVDYDSSVLMMYQLVVVAFCLSPAYFILDASHILDFIPSLLFLSIVTTAMGHTFFLYSLKHFSTVTASIISCSQPIYGIILGIFALGEFPSSTTLIGGGIIILTIVAESIRINRVTNTIFK
jgi:drug/metabolite transporter (DMT)-like permease